MTDGDGMIARSPLARLNVAQQEKLFRLLKKAGFDPAQFTCRGLDIESTPPAASNEGRRR